MKKRYISSALFLVLLALSSFACSIFVGGPDYPAQTVPASADELQAMKTQIEEALLAGAESGIVALQITESQLTSYLAQKMQESQSPLFADPQVLLRSGQMQVYGKFNRGWFTANMLVVMNVSVDPAANQPKIEVASADFGPFPAPEGFNAAVSAALGEAFTGSLGPVAVGFRLESIAIADGVMTLTAASNSRKALYPTCLAFRIYSARAA